jgi:hypothetical protein
MLSVTHAALPHLMRSDQRGPGPGGRADLVTGPEGAARWAGPQPARKELRNELPWFRRPRALGDNLYTFLANRLAASFDDLNCANFGLHQTVMVVTNGAGAATQVTLGDDPQVASF